jgi:dUTP pyrophosphatase
MEKLFVRRMTEHAKLLFRGSTEAAGLDIFTIEDSIIPPTGRFTTVATGISLAIPRGCFGQIQSRSGLALKNHICAFPGVIDSDFRGEIKVLLQNFGNDPVEIKRGTRVAQLIILSYTPVEIFEKTTLSSTQRGATGFGGSGLY